MPQNPRRKLNLTYPLLVLLAVLAGFGLKMLWVPEHTVTPTQAAAQSQAIVIDDINGTLSAEDHAFLQEQMRWQMAFHRQYKSLPEALPVKVSLWRTTGAYRNYQSNISKTSTSSKGFYSGSRRELVINGEKSGYRQTLAHEAQHLLLRWKGLKPRPWLNEGLSEYFETLEIRGPRQAVSLAHAARVQRLQAFARAGQLPPLPGFFDEDKRHWRARDKHTPYVSQDTAWALVYFFMQNTRGQTALLAVLQALAQKDDTAVFTLIDQVYPLSTLRTDFAAFLAEIPTEQPVPYTP